MFQIENFAQNYVESIYIIHVCTDASRQFIWVVKLNTISTFKTSFNVYTHVCVLLKLTFK
jgi:hypothetical protein